MFHPLNTITAYKGQIIYDTPATQAKAQTPIPELTWIPAPGTHPVQNPADLQNLLVPPAPGAGPPAAGPAPTAGSPPGYGPAPGPGPGPGPAAASPIPRPAPGPPLPAEQGGGR
jgi:phospholipid/cholesterol/gamma-HCH transport system substrate-binding protein